MTLKDLIRWLKDEQTIRLFHEAGFDVQVRPISPDPPTEKPSAKTSSEKPQALSYLEEHWSSIQSAASRMATSDPRMKKLANWMLASSPTGVSTISGGLEVEVTVSDPTVFEAMSQEIEDAETAFSRAFEAITKRVRAFKFVLSPVNDSVADKLANGLSAKAE